MPDLGRVVSGREEVMSGEVGSRELRALEAERPELAPWLRPLGIALAAIATEPWQSLAPLCSASRESGAPLLHDAMISLNPVAARNHVTTVLVAALGADARQHVFDAAALLEAAVAHDDDRMATLASAAQIDPSALAVAAQLAAVTLLQSCNRAFGATAVAGWTLGYCPVCGAQPTLAEVLGLERKRHLRCGRCGAGWSTDVLLCPFCGERDHERLASLVPDGTAGQLSWAETCVTCHGYLKVRATLRAASPQMVLIEDARSIELDLAAAERGFHRPDRPGFTVRVRLSLLPVAMI